MHCHYLYLDLNTKLVFPEGFFPPHDPYHFETLKKKNNSRGRNATTVGMVCEFWL